MSVSLSLVSSISIIINNAGSGRYPSQSQLLLTEWILWVVHDFNIDDSVHGLKPARHFKLLVFSWQGQPLTEHNLVGTDFILFDFVTVKVVDIFTHPLSSWDVGSLLCHSFVHTEDGCGHNGAVWGWR